MDTLATDLLVGFGAELRSRATKTSADLALLERRLERSGRVAVVCGAGIAGLVAASTFSRSSLDDVVLVVGQPPLRKRLVDGCTLRRSTIATFAHATGATFDQIVGRLGGARGAFDGGLILRGIKRSPKWSIDVSPNVKLDAMVGMSTRHGEILSALRELVPDSPRLHLVAGSVQPGGPGDESALSIPIQLADGVGRLRVPKDRSVILNATGKGQLFARPDAPRAAVQRWVATAQAPMRLRGAGPRWGTSAIAFFLDAPPLQHVALFTPFADPDTPEARWYGINTTVIESDALESLGRAKVAEEIRVAMFEMADELQLEGVDVDETLGEAILPLDRRFDATVDATLPVVPTSACFSPGTAAINADGMLAAALGSLTFADRYARARELDPARAARLALAGSKDALTGARWRNQLVEWYFFRAPGWVRTSGVRYSTAPPLRAYFEDFATLGQT